MESDAGHGAPGATLVRSGVTDARVAAARILADVRRGELLDAAFDRHTRALDARDRRWVHELVYGLLRRRDAVDAELQSRVRGGLARLDADLVDLLRLGVTQLLDMGSVPAYAAIGQTVELAKIRHGVGASRLVNAVLRRLDREREQRADPAALARDDVDALALRHSHPRWLVERWLGQWGLDDTQRLLEHNNTEAPIVVRPYGVVREQLETSLERSGVHVEDVPLVPDSLRLSGAGMLTQLGAWRHGWFFVQDPAATLVTRYAAIPARSVVGDLAAAPGGKTLELARDAALVVAADRSLPRLERLRDNLARLDVRNVALIAMDVRDPAVIALAAVLLDVPCTGTGTFRRHPDARWRLRISDLAVLTALQKAMLESAATVVRPGGLLVYSTCSLEPEENDEQVDAFLAAHPEWTLDPPPDGSVPAEVLDRGRLRVLPQRHGTDGAFAARLRRAAA